MTAATPLEPVRDRDYVGDMRAAIDAATEGGDPYVSRQVAASLVRKLRAVDPDLLDGFLQAQAETIIWQVVNDRDRSVRARVRQTANRAAFGKAAEAFARGDSTALIGFLAMPFAVEDGSRKRLADLTSDDLAYVAASYEHRAEENAMTAAFLRAVAKKVGTDLVSDHFTDDELTRLWTSLAR